MSVRIIFRGLILFRFPEKNGKMPRPDSIVAQLINKPELPSRPNKKGAKTPAQGHEHYHGAEIQIQTGVGNESPEMLNPGENVTIEVIDGATGVVVEPSFLQHVPELSQVIAKGTTDEIARLTPVNPNPRLIQNTVIVDRGNLRVRNVVTWDEGGFPLATKEIGRVPASHALVNFVGSTMQGHIASEFVVDIPEATGVLLTTKNIPSTDKVRHEKLNGRKSATSAFNQRVRHGDVEILITNYEFQRDRAVPWGLDFQWLFETLGYGTVDLAAAGFTDFERAASDYDRQLFETEVEMLLERTRGGAFTTGRPFPYIASPKSLTGLTGLAQTDEESRPICIGAFQPGAPPT